MKALAIISHLSVFVLAILAIVCCIGLYRHHRQIAWLILGAMFLEPFWFLLMRAIKGRPLLAYMSVGAGADGSQIIHYRIGFPFFYILAVIGLYLLVQNARRKP
jgi:hypothetical protein